jgi:hypothetical protein
MMKPMIVAKLAARVCLVGILVIGVVSVGQVFLSAISADISWPIVSAWWRLPLSVTDIVVDKNGTIYTRNNGERIQVYDSQGDFLKGWSFGKGGYLLLEQDGKSFIAVRQRRSSVRFDQKGNKLAEWEDSGHYERIADERIQQGMSIPSFKDGEGNVYRQEGWILHSIVRVDRSGQKTIIVRDPVYVGIFDYVLGILLVIFSLAALKLGRHIVRRQRNSLGPQNVDATKTEAGR